MPRKRHKPYKIVARLRQAAALVTRGKSVADAVRDVGASEVAHGRRRQEFDGSKSDQAKRTKDLEAENARLLQAVSDLTLGKTILAEAAIRVDRRIERSM